VIRLLLRSQRYELRADRIVEPIVPIDQGKKVRRNSEGHRRLPQPGGEIFVKGVRDEIPESVAQLPDICDGVFLLKSVGLEFLPGYMPVRGKAAPKLVAAERTVVGCGEAATRRLLRGRAGGGEGGGINVSGIDEHSDGAVLLVLRGRGY
jgi:hypothetical protein